MRKVFSVFLSLVYCVCLVVFPVNSCHSGCVKAPELRHPKRGSVRPYEPLLRCLNSGSFHVSPSGKNFDRQGLGAQEQPSVSIIIPVINEEARIESLCEALEQLEPLPEVIFVDGGSLDGTVALLQQREYRCICLKQANRAKQFNAGIALARGQVLLFLHADSHLTPEGYQSLLKAVDTCMGGAFSYALEDSDEDWRKRLIETGVTWRNKLFHLPYGDQGYFVTRKALEQVGVFREMPLMEDVEWFERLKNTRQYVILDAKVTTSGRRIFQRGWIRSCCLNSMLVLLYKMGLDPEVLARVYYAGRKPSEEEKEKRDGQKRWQKRCTEADQRAPCLWRDESRERDCH